MGESEKKSGSEVAAGVAPAPTNSPVVAPAPTKSLTKKVGKRGAEDVIVTAKKQKVGENTSEIKVENKVSETKAESLPEETKVTAPALNENVDSDSSGSDSSDVEEDAPTVPAQVSVENGKTPTASPEVAVAVVVADVEEVVPAKEAPAAAAVAIVEEVVPAKEAPAAAMEEDDSGDEESSDEESSEEGAPQPTVVEKTTAEANEAQKAESSEDGSSEDEEPDMQKSEIPSITVSKKECSPEEESEDSEEESEDSEEDSEDVKATETPKKNDTDVEMINASAEKKTEKIPNTPTTMKEQPTVSKVLFVGNLSFSAEQADVEKFFKPAGEVVEVRFSMSADGSFRGFGHVEFATPEQAKKALEELNGHDLLGREVRLDPANERGAPKVKRTPHSRDAPSFKSPPGPEVQTVFVRGFDKYEGEDQVRSSLQEHFGSCGEITRVSIPTDEDGVKGIAYIDFKDANAFNKALELNGSDLGSRNLFVDAASSGGRGRRGRDVGRPGRGGRRRR